VLDRLPPASASDDANVDERVVPLHSPVAADSPTDLIAAALWETADGALGTLLAWAVLERGRATVVEGLRLALDSQTARPPSIDRALRTLDDLDLVELTQAYGNTFDVRHHLSTLLEGLDSRELQITDQRLVALAKTPTLEDLGLTSGLLESVSVKSNVGLRCDYAKVSRRCRR